MPRLTGAGRQERTDGRLRTLLTWLQSAGALVSKQHVLQKSPRSIGRTAAMLNPLFEGMVLDGWNRYLAANDVGMDCPSVELGDTDPKDFVMAQNKARRHITQAQLAMATTAVYAWHPAHRPVNSALSADLPKSTKQLSEISGASTRSIEQAKAIQSKATPEVQEAVRRGDIGLPKAAAIAKMPQAEQAAAIHKPLPKPVAVVEVLKAVKAHSLVAWAKRKRESAKVSGADNAE